MIIDTRLAGIADNLSNYMSLKNISDKIDLELSNSRLMQLNEMVCYPAEIEGQLDFIYHKFLAARLKKIVLGFIQILSINYENIYYIFMSLQ